MTVSLFFSYCVPLKLLSSTGSYHTLLFCRISWYMF